MKLSKGKISKILKTKNQSAKKRKHKHKNKSKYNKTKLVYLTKKNKKNKKTFNIRKQTLKKKKRPKKKRNGIMNGGSNLSNHSNAIKEDTINTKENTIDLFKKLSTTLYDKTIATLNTKLSSDTSA